MIFDNSINLGQMIEALAFVSSIIAAYFGAKNSIALISNREELRYQQTNNRFDNVESELKKQTSILVDLATQKERLDNLSNRMSYLEHGRMEGKSNVN